jgi:hypothetical protein
MPIKAEYILFAAIILVVSYIIFYKKETFINRKLENFNGDDLNVHKYDDLNVVDHQNIDDQNIDNQNIDDNKEQQENIIE